MLRLFFGGRTSVFDQIERRNALSLDELCLFSDQFSQTVTPEVLSDTLVEGAKFGKSIPAKRLRIRYPFLLL